MSLVRRSARECFDAWRKHVASVIASTLTKDQQVGRVEVSPTVESLEFRAGAVPLKTTVGSVYFHFMQGLRAKAVTNREFNLELMKYSYRLQIRDISVAGEPLFRWEYEFDDQGKHTTRPHLHVGEKVQLELTNSTLDISRIHLPTGLVTIEAILRFLFSELQVKPRCRDWLDLLAASERSYYQHFAFGF